MMYGNTDVYALWRDTTANGYFRWREEAGSFETLAAGLPYQQCQQEHNERSSITQQFREAT